MKRYRIIQGEGYNGCIPITIYWVQIKDERLFSANWRNVKRFDNYERAKELLNFLEGDLNYEKNSTNR